MGKLIKLEMEAASSPRSDRLSGPCSGSGSGRRNCRALGDLGVCKGGATNALGIRPLLNGLDALMWQGRFIGCVQALCSGVRISVEAAWELAVHAASPLLSCSTRSMIWTLRRRCSSCDSDHRMQTHVQVSNEQSLGFHPMQICMIG